MNREKAVNREKANVMAAASGRRRLRALEGLILIVSLTEYAPLTFAEIEAIAHRVRRSGRLTAWDVTTLACRLAGCCLRTAVQRRRSGGGRGVMTGLSRRLAVLERVRVRSAHGGTLPFGIAPADQPPVLAALSAWELGVIFDANRLYSAGRMAEFTDDMCLAWNRMLDELRRHRDALARVLPRAKPGGAVALR